jgi:hydroxymethylbilane synthase
VRLLHDPVVAEATACERAVLKGLGGGCHLPLGAYAQRQGDRIELRAALAQLDPAISQATLSRAHVFAPTVSAAAEGALAALDGRAA